MYSVPSLLFSSLSELLGDLLNGASVTPVSTTTVVGRDFFFGEWMDEVNGGGGGAGVQSVTITVPFRSISLNGCALAAQCNSGIVACAHSIVTTTNHLEVVAGDVCSVHSHTIPLTNSSMTLIQWHILSKYCFYFISHLLFMFITPVPFIRKSF